MIVKACLWLFQNSSYPHLFTNEVHKMLKFATFELLRGLSSNQRFKNSNDTLKKDFDQVFCQPPPNIFEKLNVCTVL